MTEPTDQVTELAKRVDELAGENARLQEQLDSERETVAQATTWAGRFAGWVVWGPGLTSAWERFVDKAAETKSVPRREGSHVLAAVTRRFAFVSMFAFAALAIPNWLLHQQNVLIAEQYDALLVQNEKVQVQIEQAKERGYWERRAQLTTTLYQRGAGCPPHERLPTLTQRLRKPVVPPIPVCPPIASWQAREAAVLELVTLERQRRFGDRYARLADYVLPSGEPFLSDWLRLVGCELDGADLSRADLRFVIFAQCRMRWTTFHSSDLRQAGIINSVLDGSHMLRAALAGANLSGSRFDGAALDHADLRDVYCHDTSFKGANLNEVDARNGRFNGSFEGATLTNAKLAQATFVGVRFHGADLTDSVLHGAMFKNTVLTGADLSGASLTDVTWDNTTCPDGTNSDDNDGRTCIGHLEPAAAE